MEDQKILIRRKIHDFSNGPVHDEALDRYVYDGRDPNGRRIKKRWRQKQKADRWWRRYLTSIEDGTWSGAKQRKKMTFGEAADLYRRSAQVTNLSYWNYTHRSMRFWEGALHRETPLTKVTKLQIEEAIAKRIETDGIGKKTANMNLGVIKRFFSWLQEEDIFLDNPTRKIREFKLNNDGRVVYLNSDQFTRLLEACKRQSWYLQPMVIIAAGTGLRKANVLKLEWSEVDFITRRIRVTRTKTFKTYIIPMCETVYDTLQTLYQTRHERPDSEYVFPSTHRHRAGLPFGQIDGPWKRALIASGIAKDFEQAKKPPFRWHDLRHCFASWLVMGGVNIATVSKLLGHTKVAMTERYVHLSEQFMQDSVVKINDMFQPNH